MPKVQPPELKKFMDKKLSRWECRPHVPRAGGTADRSNPSNPSLLAVTLNANRQVTGVLRGFDQFMNLVLDATVDEKMKTDIGMVVRLRGIPQICLSTCSQADILCGDMHKVEGSRMQSLSEAGYYIQVHGQARICMLGIHATASSPLKLWSRSTDACLRNKDSSWNSLFYTKLGPYLKACASGLVLPINNMILGVTVTAACSAFAMGPCAGMQVLTNVGTCSAKL
eukprot:355301-Chlamydomonas_euryale.AAC.4